MKKVKKLEQYNNIVSTSNQTKKLRKGSPAFNIKLINLLSDI